MLACAKSVCQLQVSRSFFRSYFVRIKTKWNLKERERSLSETASAVAFILWRIGQQGILNLENEGFQTDTFAQRVDIMEEFLAFLVHIVDRMTADDLSMEERQIFITALARHLADRVQENRADIQGSGEYRQALIELLNRHYFHNSVEDSFGPGIIAFFVQLYGEVDKSEAKPQYGSGPFGIIVNKNIGIIHITPGEIIHEPVVKDICINAGIHSS